MNTEKSQRAHRVSTSEAGFDSRENLGFWFGVIAVAHLLILWVLYAVMFRDVEIPDTVPNEKMENEQEEAVPWTDYREPEGKPIKLRATSDAG